MANERGHDWFQPKGLAIVYISIYILKKPGS